jgi:tRNA threonylcarbamoyladenosine biosynthesis protein TsaE
VSELSRITRSEADTRAFAQQLADRLHPSDVLLISGPLGAGKTALVRGIAAGLGIDPDAVSSPTFTLVHEYRGGRLPLYHVDLYRLEQAAMEELGLAEPGVADGVLAIEWPERLAHPIPGAARVTIDVLDDETRRIVYSMR